MKAVGKARTVLIADDHAIVRDGLRMLLETSGEFSVVGEAGEGREVVRQALELHPEVAIMDIAMPELNGIEAARMITEACPRTRVVILSMYGTKEHVFRALKAGALGYVLKRSAGPELVQALKAVCRGERYLSREITDVVIDDYLSSGSADPTRDPLAELSQREREVLQLLAEGHDNKTIADLIHLSPKSVHTYRSRAMQKLGLHDTAALIRFALLTTKTPED
jgi:two-component system, NarL family, response regulator NreC